MNRTRSQPVRRARRAFTLIELLVVVAIIASLIAILLPSMTEARETARIAACGSNMKQIMSAWFAYTLSNKNELVGGHPPDPTGWVKPGPDAQNIEDGSLYEYLNSVEVYRCPSDNRETVYDWGTGTVSGSAPYLRSYSVSMYMHTNGVDWSVDRLTSIRHPTTAMVLLGEPDPRGWNWGSWTTGMGSNWTDWPAGWHLGGVSLSFADSHVEYYKHRDPATPQITWFFAPAPGSPDLEYFQRIYRPDLQ